MHTAQVFLEHSSALRAEKNSRDPCRIDPAIEPHSYTDPDVSKYFFHGWQIGPATVDDDRTVRTNKQCYICQVHGSRRYGMDDEDKKFWGRQVEKVKSGVRNILVGEKVSFTVMHYRPLRVKYK